MSCGVASGVVALILAKNPNLNAYQVYNQLFQLSNQPSETYPVIKPSTPIIISNVPSGTIDLSACASSF
jgi:subtilisin family serine protease